jgi:hypothetical protein
MNNGRFTRKEKPSLEAKRYSEANVNRGNASQTDGGCYSLYTADEDNGRFTKKEESQPKAKMCSEGNINRASVKSRQPIKLLFSFSLSKPNCSFHNRSRQGPVCKHPFARQIKGRLERQIHIKGINVP